MYRTLHEDLSHAAEAVRLRDALRAQHEAVAQRLESERARHDQLAEQLRRERKDVARLEGISFQRLFAMLGGELDERLEREREEAGVAELRFVEQDQLVAALRVELDVLERRIAELGDVDARYKEALETKGRLLVERTDEHGRLVLALAEAHSQASAMHRELREAIDCGNELARLLAEAAQAIGKAQSHGTWDLLGGGWLATMAKNGQLDEASRLINAAHAVFARFRKELADVEGMVLAEGEVGEAHTRIKSPLVGLADYVLDGLLVDFLIQRKIDRLALDVSTFRVEVRRRLERLAEAEAENEERRRERRTRLEEAIRAG